MPRHDQLLRQWRLLRRLDLNPAGIDLAEADSDAASASTSARTRYRDLEALQLAGFPLVREQVGRRVRWRLHGDFRRSFGQPITLSEAFALRWLRQSAEAPRGGLLDEPLETLFGKLDASLTPELRAYLARLEEVLVADRFGLPLAELRSPVVEQLTRACSDRRCVELDYRDQRGQTTVRRLDPYNLWHHRRGHYLIAWCHARQALRTFALWRVQGVRETGEHFAPRADYAFDRYVERHFRIMEEGQPETVRIWFAAEAALYVQETRWHPTQRITPREGGAIELEMTVDGLTEVAAWVLGFGPRARVLAPARLVADVRAPLRGALERYGEGEGDGVADEGAVAAVAGAETGGQGRGDPRSANEGSGAEGDRPRSRGGRRKRAKNVEDH